MEKTVKFIEMISHIAEVINAITVIMLVVFSISKAEKLATPLFGVSRISLLN